MFICLLYDSLLDANFQDEANIQTQILHKAQKPMA